jgi:hypothetical protein
MVDLPRTENTAAASATIPAVVVDARGPGPDAAFGPGNSPSGTNGVLEALHSGARRLILRGSFVVTHPTNLGSGIRLEFDQARLALGASVNIFQAGGQRDLEFVGTVAFDGGRSGGFAGFGFLLNGCERVRFDWTADVAGFSSEPGKFLINANPQGARAGRSFRLAGRTTTHDSTVVRVNGWSDIEIAGVQTPPTGLTTAVPLAPVAVVNDGTSGPMETVSIHDCDLDGGGIQRVSGLVRVFGGPGPGAIRSVRCAHLRLRNTIPVPSRGLSDALDLNHCSQVEVVDVSGDRVCDLVSCVASHATVTDCHAEDCNGVGILVGDGGSQTETVEDVTVRNCVARNCGRGLQSVNSAGIGVASSRGTTTRGVRFVDCRSDDPAGGVQRYGFSVNALGTIDDLAIEGGSLAGFEGPIANPSRARLSLRGVAGIPDSG